MEGNEKGVLWLCSFVFALLMCVGLVDACWSCRFCVYIYIYTSTYTRRSASNIIVKVEYTNCSILCDILILALLIAS